MTNINEVKMSSSRLKSVIGEMENESLIGFEVELLVGPKSKYYIAMPNPEYEVETLSFSRVSDISDLADVPGISLKDLQRLTRVFQQWQAEQVKQYVDDRFDALLDDFDGDEDLARAEMENRAWETADEKYNFKEFIDDYKNPREAMTQNAIDPTYGWRDNWEILLGTPEYDHKLYHKNWETIRDYIDGDLFSLKVNVVDDSSIKDDDGKSTDDDDGMEGYGYEIVTYKLAPSQALEKLETIFEWMQESNIRTNESTGLHINISIADMKSVDPVKLILFMGDDYILNAFDRSNSKFAKSQLQTVADSVKNNRDFSREENGIYKIAERALKATGKYSSVNFLKLVQGYLEFRSAGNENYHLRGDDIINTVGRLLTALNIAADKNLYREEFLKKLALLGADLEEDILVKFAPDRKTFAHFKKKFNELVPSIQSHVFLKAMIVLLGESEKQFTIAHYNEIKKLFSKAKITPKDLVDSFSGNTSATLRELLTRFKFLK